MSIHDETFDRPYCHYCHTEIKYGEKEQHLQCGVLPAIAKNREFKFRVWQDKVSRFNYFGLTDAVRGLVYLHPYPVEQYVGMKDVKDKDIYEGDIVSFKYGMGGNIYQEEGEVFFENGIFFFSRALELATNDANFHVDSLRVVGNIYEGKAR